MEYDKTGAIVVYKVYIIQSSANGRFYCGQSDDLNRRLIQHNDSDYRGSLTTKRFPGPWKLVWSESHETRSSAMHRERQIKKRGIGRFLEGLSLKEIRNGNDI